MSTKKPSLCKNLKYRDHANHLDYCILIIFFLNLFLLRNYLHRYIKDTNKIDIENLIESN
jgi:hypothetical protein